MGSQNLDDDILASLTERQVAVLELNSVRKPLKVIALELGISQARVNQHIKTLKEKLKVNTLNELADCYRVSMEKSPYRKPIYSKNRVPACQISGEQGAKDAAGHFVLHDSIPFGMQAPWETKVGERIVPGMLDGDHAVTARLFLVVFIALGLLASVALIITVYMSLDAAVNDVVYVSPNSDQPAD
ncbi:hypothetical protein GRI44_02535 [Altererythrobacter confluentis]|uniref:HTH luxR-type domain-containing protein n=1 Tax=Allopontixanthobacter confluentis TaxID=1849021 RepID=A0A6L7GDG0_9SPHN|nr:LuxR C-terminal-related transcriptional regulator [Allopontixanthobacter confluentis]MXP13630.1 hypothetical protein [Allopontixanthobacter confluentis]